MEKARVLVLMATWAVVETRGLQANVNTNGAPRLHNDDVTSIEAVNSMNASVGASNSDKEDILSLKMCHKASNLAYTHDFSSIFTKRSVKNLLLDDMLAGNSWPIDTHLFQMFLQDYVMRYTIEKVYFLHISNGECICNKILIIMHFWKEDIINVMLFMIEIILKNRWYIYSIALLYFLICFIYLLLIGPWILKCIGNN